MNKAVIVCSQTSGALYVNGELKKVIDESVVQDEFWFLQSAAKYSFYPSDCFAVDLVPEDSDWVIKIGTFPKYIYDFSSSYDFMPNKVDKEIV